MFTPKTCIVATMLLAILAATWPARCQEEIYDGQSFKYGEWKRYDTLDPVTSNSMESLRLCELVYESLVAQNKDLVLVPQLADTWKISPDSRTITFTLKPGVIWADPQNLKKPAAQRQSIPFTAKDVLTTVNVIKNQNTVCTNNLLHYQMNNIERVTVIDANTIEFKLTKVFSHPEELFTFKILPAYVFGQNQTCLTKNSLLANQTPIGTGCYQFYNKNEGGVSFTWNQNHLPNKPHLASVNMVLEVDRSNMAEKCELDLIQSIIELPIHMIPRFNSNHNFMLLPYNSMTFDYLGFNIKHPPLNVKAFRQALTMAVDRNKILEDVYLGHGERISGPYPPGSPFINLDVPLWPYDPARAKYLLDSLNFRDTDGDSIREYQGKRIVLTLKIAQSSVTEDEPLVAANYIKTDWKRVGIELEIVLVEAERLRKEVFDDKNFEVSYQSWHFDEANDVSTLFCTDKSNNYISYSNPRVDAIIKAIEVSDNETQLISLNRQLHQILRDDCPYLFLWTLEKNAVMSTSVHNGDLIHKFKFFSFIDQWYMRPDLK